MPFTVIVPDKPFYSVSEVMFITQLSRPVVKGNFKLVEAPGVSKFPRIALEDVQNFMDGKKGADNVKS